MAPPHVFAIEVENGDKPFYPGQHISGKVILQCQEKKKLHRIYLTLMGQAYIRLYDSYGYNYIEREPYFNHQVDLWQEKDGEEFIKPGNYEWPFSFQLPSVSLPTSYECFYGNIRYWLEARMDRPWKFDHVTKFAFTILERVDLNLSPEDLSFPRRGEGQKTLGCLCCESGPLSLTVSTNRGAYCSGEQILVTARLENNTNKEMRMLKATLARHVRVYARGSSRLHTDIVSQMKTTEGIAPRQTFEWNQQPLPIPACPPSSHTCKIVHSDYLLDVEVVVPTFSINLHVVLPIVVGTEPLRSVYGNSAFPTIGFSNTEAVNIADNQYTMGQTQFAPMLSMVQMPPQGEVGNQPPAYSPCPPALPSASVYPPVSESGPAPPYSV
jgi:hypothetical protein